MITDTLEQHPTDQQYDYDAFVQAINNRYNALTGPIFETDAAGLYDAYLASFTNPTDRQYHTCSCCRAFIERFGHLAVVDTDGQLVSAVWNEADAPEHYKPAMAAMARLVRRAKLTMPFLSSDTVYGTPISGNRKDGVGQWHHFAVEPAAARIYRGPATVTAFQAASAKREERSSVMVALGEYSKATVAAALNLLENDQLGRSEAAVAQAKFLADLHAITAAGAARSNLIYAAVATAPSGFCHPRSGMIATLLDDIAAGKSFDRILASWNAKMHPLAYQRPQAAPTAGAIKAAEEAFNKLGAASALKRRFARLDDVLQKLWEPKAAAPAPAAGGIFGSVKAKDAAPAAATLKAPAITMTWAKFSSTVLPGADKIEVLIGHGHENFAALTTAVDPDAVPLLQWDSVERRNPVALYLWNGGSPARQWNLAPGQYHKVNAITLRPSMWFGADLPHQNQGALLIIDDCRDSRDGAGSALFPSTLRSEYRAYSSVIESFSNANQLEGRAEQSASGLMIDKGGNIGATVRVTMAGQVNEYKIDRWD